MKKITSILIVLLLGINVYSSDILTLNNEKVFTGKISKIKGCSVLFISEGNKYVIPASEIYFIQFENIESKVYTKYMEMGDDDPNKCLNGKLDAENFHGKKGGHIALGFLFGPFAILGTALANPTPDKGKRTYLLSENKDQFSDLEYISCYKKKAKGQLIGMEAIGWGALILLILII